MLVIYVGYSLLTTEQLCFQIKGIRFSTLICKSKQELKDSGFKMSLQVKRDEEDTASKMSSPYPGSSCVSLKTNRSMKEPNKFSDGSVTSDPR